jgi:hypothetical protein
MREDLKRGRALIKFAVVAASLALSSICGGQTSAPLGPSPSAPSSSAPLGPSPSASSSALPTSLDAFAWLRGCWSGSVNRREFIEQWSPPRGGMMIGFSHTVVAPKFQGSLREKMEAVGKTSADPGKDKTQDFEYLRLESRDDGIYYIDVPSGKKEIAFRLASVGEESGATVFTFNNTVDEFPQRLIYRRGSEGWLYAQVGGNPGVTGADVVYPMRHVDCATDAFLKE